VGILFVYILFPGSSRAKTIAGLSTLCIAIPSAIYFYAVENPNSFHRFIVEYIHTGKLPSQISNNSEELKNIVNSKLLEEINNKILPTDNLDKLLTIISDYLFSSFIYIFKPVEVKGYLIGQQLFIYFLLFIIL